MSHDKRNLRGALTALLSMGIYATHDVVVKSLGASYTPFQIVFFSSVLSFPLVTLFILQEKEGGSLSTQSGMGGDTDTIDDRHHGFGVLRVQQGAACPDLQSSLRFPC